MVHPRCPAGRGHFDRYPLDAIRWYKDIGVSITVIIRFASRDAARIPEHWRGLVPRATPLLTSKTTRNAADPANAILNYCYSLLKSEAVLAVTAVGLDTGLGVIHADRRDSSSLALV